MRQRGQQRYGGPAVVHVCTRAFQDGPAVLIFRTGSVLVEGCEAGGLDRHTWGQIMSISEARQALI